MKKLIYIFTIFICLFIFYDSFKEYSTIEVERVENAFDGIGSEEVVLIDISVGNDKNKFYDDLINFVKYNGETAYLFQSYQNKDMIDYSVTYLYSRNTEELFENNKIHLEKNDAIDFSKHTSDYYSTDLEEICYNHIVFLDRDLNKLYNKIYKFYQFEEIRKVDNVDSFFVFFITDHVNQLKEKISNSNMASYVVDYPSFDNISQRNIDMDFFNKMLIISAIIILLLIACDIFKRKKEIMIRKLNGMSDLYIAFRIYYKQFLISSLLYFITFIICYCIWIGRIHEVAYEFIQVQLRYFGLFVLLNIVVWILIYVMIHFMKSANELKKTAYLKVISISDVVLKVIVLILLINPLIEYTRLGIKETYNLYNIINNRDVLRNQIYVDSLQEGNVHGIGSVSSCVQDYMHEKGAIYQDFTRYYEFANFENSYELPYIMVNTNYMKDYEVVDATTNKVLDFTNIEKEVLLIPEKYKEEDIDISMYNENTDCDIIYVKNGTKYLTHDPVTGSIYGWYMKDPIVFVEDRIRNWCHPFLFLSYDNMNDVNQIKKDLEKMGIIKNCDLNVINKRYDIVFEQIKDNCLEVLFIMVVYAIVICVFLYQSIFIYFIENKEKCALKYIHGYSFMERHGEMLLMNISIYIIPLLVGWFYYHIPLVELLLVIGIAIIFEIFSMWIITRIFEKNKIIEILKGE